MAPIDVFNTDSLQSLIGQAKSAKSHDDLVREAILATLAKLGGLTVGEDSLVFQGSKFILPAHMEGNIDSAIDFLMNHKRSMEKRHNFRREFSYRWQDGAAAFERAMKSLFGTSGIGGTIRSFFGDTPPEYRTVFVNSTESIQVPWNKIDFPSLDASFILDTAWSEDYGLIFQIHASAPRKYRKEIEALFQLVDQELRNHSIYRGKAIYGGTDGTFVDIDSLDPNKVVYSEATRRELEVNVWSLLRHTDSQRKNGLPLKRSVLVEGAYGTGKTLAGFLTAKVAVENGWTFILARPGRDDLSDVLRTAQLYSPAVVWCEDIDVTAKGDNDLQVSQLLDTLDGISAKGTDIIAGFTTNFPEKIQKGILRPGRLDAVIHFEGLDAAGYEKLVKVVVAPESLGDIDYPRVVEAFSGLLPAFAREAIDRAKRYSISRNNGVLGTINTEDLIHAAEGLRPQLALMNDATEGVERNHLHKGLTQLVRSAMHETGIVDRSGDRVLSIDSVAPGEMIHSN